MSKSIARRFIQEMFNEGKIEEVANFVTPNITHGVFDQVKRSGRFQALDGRSQGVF